MIHSSQKMREKIADEQHEIWSHWMIYLFKISKDNPDGSVTISADSAAHWRRQILTPYAKLTEREKDSDREQADKIIKVLSHEA